MKTDPLKETKQKIKFARQDIGFKKWRLKKLKVKKQAIEAKNLFFSDPNYKDHPKAHELIDCFDSIIENST